MKQFIVVFRIQGDCDLITCLDIVTAFDTKHALRLLHSANKLKEDFPVTDEEFLDILDKGKRTGGEDSAVLGFLPRMEESWIIDNETDVAIAAIEMGQLFCSLILSQKLT